MAPTASERRPEYGTVRVRLFATARTAVGRGRLDWPTPPDGLTARHLLDALVAQHPALRPIVRTSRIFLDGEPLPRLTYRVRPGHELAIHPPYGGG